MPAISYASGPYYPLSIIKPCVADDEDFRQWAAFVEAMILAAGWTEVYDAGYLQLWQNAMAFSTTSNNGAGMTGGGTNSSSPTQYPNIAMDGNTSTFWQSNGQPVLNAAHYSLGYDAGIGNVISPTYAKMWLQGFATGTDPITFVREWSDVMDANYSWELAAWVPCGSWMNVNTTNGAFSVGSVTLSAISGTGYTVNTAATVGTGGGASTTTTASYAIASSIAPATLTLSVASITSFAPGDYILVSDGTHTNHAVVTGTSAGTITATLLPVSGDSTSGTMASAATVTQCGLGAVVQPVVASGAVTSVLIANPGTKYHVGDVLAFQVASAGSGATATVASVNLAGMIQSITVSAGGSSYVANPICTGTGGTGSCQYAVFTNAALGVGGAIQQVIPCVSLVVATYQSGGGGYAYGTPPTLTISQATGGSSPSGAGTPTAVLTMTTGGVAQLNTFTLPVPFWTSVGSSPVGPTHRAFRTRVLANVSSGTSVNIYEDQLFNYAGAQLNGSPFRLAPSNSQTNTMIGWKLFQMQDTLQSTTPVYMKVYFGNGATWNYPSIQVQLGPGTDGMGNLVGPTVTQTMTLAGGVGSSGVSPAWAIGNTDWLHIELFKGGAAEIVLHVERLQTVAGADDATQGAAVFGATGLNPTSGVAYATVMPAIGGAPSAVETQWGCPLGTVAGSVQGAVMTLYPLTAHNSGMAYPLKNMAIADRTGAVVTNGATFSYVNSYGVTQTGFVGGWQETKVASNPALTSGVLIVRATQ